MSNLLLQALKTAPAGGIRPDGSAALQWYKFNEASNRVPNYGTAGGNALFTQAGAALGQPLSTLTWAANSVQLYSKDTDYVEGAGNIDPLVGASTWSVSFWTYLTAVPDTSGPYKTSILVQRQSYITYAQQFYAYWGANGGGGYYADYDVVWVGNETVNGGAYGRYYVPFSANLLNKICYWTLTRNGNNAFPELYINGVAQTPANPGAYGGSFGAIKAVGGVTQIGCVPNQYGKSVPGIYTNLIIDNTYTTTAQALTTYNAGLP